MIIFNLKTKFNDDEPGVLYYKKVNELINFKQMLIISP